MPQNADTTIEELMRLEGQPLNVIFTFLAERVHDAVLNDGQHLRDATDFSGWLRELAFASEAPADPRIARCSKLAAFCYRCGHAHEPGTECGLDMGGAGICECRGPQ